MFRRLTKAIYYGVAIFEHFKDTVMHPVVYEEVHVGSPPPEDDPEDDWLDESLDDMLDCTGKVHRRYCRKFDREVKELYWLAYDEVTEPGNYIRFEGGFHVPQTIIVAPYEGHMMELNFSQNLKPCALNQKAIYLGPLPRTPGFLEDMYLQELYD